MIQHITPGSKEEVFIETLSGVIRIAWDKERRRKRLIIETPDNLVAHKSLSRLKQALKYLHANEDGTFSPLWKLMAPKRDQQGRIIGVRRPESFIVPLSSKPKQGVNHALSPSINSDLENAAGAGIVG